PKFFAGTTVTAERSPVDDDSGGRGTGIITDPPERPRNSDKSIRVSSRAGFDQMLKTGGRVSLDLANDLLRFYTGGRNDSAFSTIMLSLAQPLLRGAGAKVAAENLTQAERNVIYEIRSFSYFQDTFAYDIVRTYLQLVQQQDTVKNQY